MGMCKHCENGDINGYGEEFFEHIECEKNSSVYRKRPRIFKTNGMYFLEIEDFTPTKIVSCPMCGRGLEAKEND
ncbi:MAG: hypothetical protein BWY15_00457 [Firmicutes bacterium ADurb.Bin193]|nr:MAG: hypothetical protein BWY15_00457 [Firmicutes bacterium ADurb.Bin193]